jgi:hypothetical protein
MSDLMWACWGPALAVIVVVAMLCLVYCGLRAKKHDASDVHAAETETLRTASRNLMAQSERLKRGLNKIAGAHDPLEAFIEAIDPERKARKGGER